MYRCRLDFGSVENKDDCVEELGRKLRLTDSEKVGLVMPEGFFDCLDGEDNLLLVGKLLLHRAISIDVLKSSLVKTWVVRGSIECKALGGNIFIFCFQNAEDKERVFHGGPWHYENNLQVLTEYMGSRHISECF